MTLDDFLSLQIDDRVVWGEDGSGGTVTERTARIREIIWDDGIVAVLEVEQVKKRAEQILAQLHKEN